VFDQCHGNKDNLVAVSFSSCTEFCIENIMNYFILKQIILRARSWLMM